MTGDDGYIDIDGSMFEGGGQILRNSVTFSCLVGKPVRVFKIRYNASKPGLKSQHLTGLQLVSQICGGKLIGDSMDSMEIKFTPGKISSGKYLADAKTAGSACLLMQISIPCLLFADATSSLVVKGGTNAEMAPPIDYFEKVFQPVVSRFGISLECKLIRRGFYPKGGGEVHVQTHAAKDLKPIEMTDFGHVVKIYGTSYVAGVLPYKVAVQTADSAKRCLSQSFEIEVNIEIIKESETKANGTGSGIIVSIANFEQVNADWDTNYFRLVAETSTGCISGSSSLGKRGKPSNQVGEEAAKALLESLHCKSCVDPHLQDQLIIFMALANGLSKLKTGPITQHTQRAIYVAEKLTSAKFTISRTTDELETNIIECQGIGFQP